MNNADLFPNLKKKAFAELFFSFGVTDDHPSWRFSSILEKNFDERTGHDSYWEGLEEHLKTVNNPHQSDAFNDIEYLPYLMNFKLAKNLNVGEFVSVAVFEPIHPVQNYILDLAKEYKMLYLLTSKGYSSKNSISLRFEGCNEDDIHRLYANFKKGDFRNMLSMSDEYHVFLSSFQFVTEIEAFIRK